MRILTRWISIAVVSLLLAPLAARAQETTPPDGTRIASAQVSGLELSKLSPGLQEDIGKLIGSALDRQKLRELAARLEAEQPRYVAAVRVTPEPDGSARVVFVVARMRDPEHQANVNAKYIVEHVDIRGVADKDITAEMRVDMEALTGKPLDSELAERLEARLKSAFGDYNVERRTGRGSQPGQIRVVFQLTRTEQSRWLRFEPLEANALYHSDQGWGAMLPLTLSGADFRVVPYFAIDNGDDLIEEYSGFGLRFETRKLGTERLGMFFEWSTFDQTWRDATLASLPAHPTVPAPYRNRMTVTPLVKFAITPRLAVSGGVSIVELDALDESSPLSQMANAAIGGVTFNQRWKPKAGVQHDLEAAFTARAGTRRSRATSPTNATLAGSITASDGRSTGSSCRASSAASRATRRCSSAFRWAIRRRSAAGTSTTSRRRAAIVYSPRPSNIGTTDSRCSSIPGRCGTPAMTARSASRQDSASRQVRRSFSWASL